MSATRAGSRIRCGDFLPPSICERVADARESSREHRLRTRHVERQIERTRLFVLRRENPDDASVVRHPESTEQKQSEVPA